MFEDLEGDEYLVLFILDRPWCLCGVVEECGVVLVGDFHSVAIFDEGEFS